MPPSDSDLVSAVLGGDREQYRHLVERHTRSVFRLAWRVTGSPDEAEDVVQETFLRAFRSLDRFDRRASFLTWILRIASNYSLDLVRARKRVVSPSEEFPDIPDTAPAADRLLFDTQIKARLAEGMQTLSEQERGAFVLRHFEGQSIGEISAILGMGESAAKHSVFRAVKKLRRYLEPALGGTA